MEFAIALTIFAGPPLFLVTFGGFGPLILHVFFAYNIDWLSLGYAGTVIGGLGAIVWIAMIFAGRGQG